jgi:imidazolonepropionase-like amidohydrolase
MAKVMITNGTVIDGYGDTPMPHTTVVVEDNLIRSVEPSADRDAAATAADEYTVIDATGKFVTPGMIDGHCHLSLHQGALEGVRYTSSAEFSTLWAARTLSQILRAGVTGVSVPGGKWFVDVTIRDAVASGLLAGPRIYCAGRALTPYGGIFDSAPTWENETPDDSVGLICNTPADYVREIRRQAKRKVDFIKLADDYWGDVQGISDEELQAAVGEAHRQNVKVAIHSRGSGSTKAAALAGVDWIFHDLATEEDLEAVAKRDIPIMPTFTAVYLAIEQGGPDRLREQLDVNLAALRMARDMGIEILVGTDTGNAAAYGHGLYHGYEAEILVREIGLTPMEALMANTRLNAKVMGLEGKVGAIRSGMLADLVVWDADPLADISTLHRPELVHSVIKDGAVLDLTQEGFLPLDHEPKRAILSR